MKLIITEKPSVAVQFSNAIHENFNRRSGYLEGNEYIITWCVGHLIAMSYPEAYDEKLKKWNLDTIPFIPKEYKYEIIEGVKEQYKVVTTMLNRQDIDEIYYAGDSAREGEYIQRLIRMYGGKNKNAVEKRIWINSQTDEEILKGIKEARLLSEYDNLSDAGYLRAQEDYLFGINLSRALTIKYGDKFNTLSGNDKSKPISVGRVMTFVLGMIVERERIIRKSTETPFYGVEGIFIKNGLSCDWKTTETSKYFDSPLLLKNGAFIKRESADALCNECNAIGKLELVNRNASDEKKQPPMLFDLSELQGTCSSLFKISPSETLEIAQALYEKKMTTYPRVDANVLSSAVAHEIHKNIFGLAALSDEITQYVEEIKKSKSYKNIENTKYVNDAKISDHYAIIPTGFAINQFSTLKEKEQLVYLLIVKRFLSIFFPAAEFSKVDCQFKCNGENFILSKKINTSLGYLDLWNTKQDEIMDIKVFHTLTSLPINGIYESKFEVTQGKTSPPKRFSSGNLVLAMKSAGQLIEDEELRAQIKNDGIGTSATRAETISKLIKIGYISLNEKTQIITPSKGGELIFDIVNNTVPSLLSAKMTASWEKGLTMVENGFITKEEYTKKINNYVSEEVNKIKDSDSDNNITKDIENLKEIYTDIGNAASRKDLICPSCGNIIRRTNWGYGCSNYMGGCKVSVGSKLFGKTISDDQLIKLITKGHSDKITGFTKKDGGNYSAKLKLDFATGKISFANNN